MNSFLRFLCHAFTNLNSARFNSIQKLPEPCKWKIKTSAKSNMKWCVFFYYRSVAVPCVGIVAKNGTFHLRHVSSFK